MKNKLIILFVSLFLLQPLFSQTEDELKLMFRIAERGHGVDVYRLRNMIQKNPSYLGVTDDDWNNFLHIASIHSNTFVFDMLEELGISSESVNKYGESLVLVHINRTRLGINPAFFKWLLERYKDTDLINKPDNYGVPPLMALVDKGFLDWVPTLHEKYGARLDVKDNDNRTIAMAMAQKNDIKYMKYLRDHGVDMLAVDDLGHDVLWYAKKANTSFDLLMMIEGFLRSDNEEYAKKIISGETGFDIGNTTLAVNKLPELLGNIHKVDIDVSIQDAKIFVLLKKLVNDGDFELLKKAFIFIEDENSRLKDIKLSDIVYENGKTLMHFACEQGHTDVVEFLYNKDNTFIDKRDLDGKNPYERALNSDNVLTSAYIKDPRSFIREKMNGMNIEASKKDLILSLQIYCDNFSTSDLDILSDNFIEKIITDGVNKQSVQILFGTNSGFFDSYSLYDHWVQNLDALDNWSYVVLVGALVLDKEEYLRDIYIASKVIDGYAVCLGVGTKNSSIKEDTQKLNKVVYKYKSIPNINNKIERTCYYTLKGF